jgi:homoserine dehydrogenase
VKGKIIELQKICLMSKKLNIGLFGFGVVGQGLYDIIRTKNLNLEIKKIAIKNPGKLRSLPQELFTTDRDEILDNPEINTVVELINDTEAALKLCRALWLRAKTWYLPVKK